MSRGAPAVTAAGLAAGYGGRPVWSGADLTIPAGSFTAVLGPNGSGKSTLVRLILGLLPPLAGRLEVLGRPPRRGNPEIGYVAQGAGFDPEFSIRGRDFVGLGIDGHRWGLPLGSHTAEVEGALRSVGAEGYAGRPLGHLSGGEQQRLLLAHALVGRPRLLLLDEPLSHLDVRNQRAVVELVADVARRTDLTVLLIAHDVNPLLPHVDQVLYVANGALHIGRPEEIITSESLSRIYSAPVEVLTDSRGRLFVVGLEEEASHPHG